MDTNTTVTVIIDDLAFGGEGVGRLDGKVCFVEGALPGETVTAEITADKQSYTKARIVDIVKPSPDRVTPPCPLYSQCGGCQYQHLSYEMQLYWKQKQVRDLFSKIGGTEDFTFHPITPSPQEYWYRSSITLHRKQGNYGFYAKGTRRVIPLEQCMITSKAINSRIQAKKTLPSLHGLSLKSNDADETFIGTVDDIYRDRFCGQNLYFSPLSFSQVNRSVAEKIVDYIKTLIGAKTDAVLFDLYCGVGFFGFLLSGCCKEVIAIENNRKAVECARSTLRTFMQDAPVRLIVSDVLNVIKPEYARVGQGPKILLVDPPRTGLDPRLIDTVTSLNDFEQMVYVSCNPATLARDIQALRKTGYWQLVEAGSFDMFPQTQHIETVAYLVR